MQIGIEKCDEENTADGDLPCHSDDVINKFVDGISVKIANVHENI